MKKFYLIISIIGFALPYYFLVKFLLEYGFDFSLLISQLFASSISAFFAIDLIITGAVYIVYSFEEAKRTGINNWWVYAAFTFTNRLAWLHDRSLGHWFR